jgi:hypothetical protein
LTPATALTFGPTAAGATSTAQVIHLWYNKGTPGGAIRNFSAQPVNPDSTPPNLASGVPWLDETWVEGRVNGGANPGLDPAFVAVTTDWYKLGSGCVLPMPDLPGNCAYYLEIRLHPPMKDGAPSASVNAEFIWNYNESAFSLAGALSDLGSGIVTGVGDRTVTEFVEAPTVLATPVTPDAVVHVSKRWYVYNGVSLRTVAADALTMAQTDGASAALTTGHEYQALISQPKGSGTGDTAAVVTPGLLATTGTSVLPALPAGNLLIASVLVSYHVTASVITQANITVLCTGGRAKPTIGTGLTVNIAAFRAVMPGARIIQRGATVVTVPLSVTSWIWLASSGTFSVSASAVPPFSGALPICSAVAGVSTVTSITDFRAYFEPLARVVSLKSFLGYGEPRSFMKIVPVRQVFPIANAAYTDCTFSNFSTECLVFAVAGKWITQPTGSTTADVGVSGTTQRYAAAVSTVPSGGVTSDFDGLKAGPLYYTAPPVIRITPNAISGTNGVLELTLHVMVIRESSTQYIGNVPVSYAWNLDRMVATVNAAGGGATGATIFDVQALTVGSLCPVGARPSIAAGSSVDATAYPNLTVGVPGQFGLFLSGVTSPGTHVEPDDPAVDLYLYPLSVAS